MTINFDHLLADPISGLREALDELASLNETYQQSNMTPHQWTMAAMPLAAAAIVLLKRLGSDFNSQIVPDSGGDDEGFKAVWEFVDRLTNSSSPIIAQAVLRSTMADFEKAANDSHAYEFTDDELKRVQACLNELRSLIQSADGFEARHKQRLLKRLEELQAEIHKEVSDLDRYLGVMYDIASSLGRAGDAARPMLKCLRELADIFLGVRQRQGELPPGEHFPLLGKPNLEEEDAASE